MTHLFIILGFITLYVLSLIGGWKGTVFFLSGFLFNLLFVGYRWMTLGHVPVTDRFDILIVMALVTAMSVFYLTVVRGMTDLMNVLPLLTAGLLFVAVFQDRIDTISPSMNSLWFYLYIILFIVGFSLMSVGSILGFVYLRSSQIDLEFLQYRFTLSGWLFFSSALIAGSVWFFLVHGVYWLWTAKELWTSIAWFYYGFYLHARFVKSIEISFVAEIGAAGLWVHLFSYLGVTSILGSPWTQF
jgi:ABC-type transport system involved in cytochrome c biogenesis permease subunit